MEKNNRELCLELNKEKKEHKLNYNELNTLKECANTSDCSLCDKCKWEGYKMWFFYDEMNCVGDYMYCDNCYNNNCWECDLCGENFDEEDEKELQLLDLTRWWDCCEKCYKERMKEKYDLLMEELKAK